MANAASGFGAKMGNGLGVAAVGWILTLGGYNGLATGQTESAITSIIAATVWLPGIALLVLYVLMRFYDLDKRYGGIVAELDARNAPPGEAATTQVSTA
jgi:GPH family glycoside/pentoside/hexuronide:cation symporter